MNGNTGRDTLLLTDTPVEDVFIRQYMSRLSKDAICLYLMLKSFAVSSFSDKKAEDLSPLYSKETKEALAELVAAGLLTRNKDNEFVFIDLKKVEVDAYCSAKIAAGGADLSELEMSPLKKECDMMCDSISKNMYGGKMGYLFYRLVDRCLYEYGFETLVIYKLFEVARDNKKQYDYKTVEKMAEEWNRKGYKTADKLDAFLEEDRRVNALISMVGRLTRKRVNEFDIERIRQWVMSGFSDELVEYAMRRSEFKGVGTKNADEILKNWMLAGVSTVDAAVEYETELHNENARKYNSNKRKKTGSRRSGNEAGIKVTEEQAETAPAAAEDDFIDILDIFGGNDDEDDQATGE